MIVKNVWFKRRLFTVGILSVAFIGKIAASTVTLTVNTNTDMPNLYPGGQTNFTGATTGDLRYCINYILNEQAQGIAQDYEIVFAPGVESIQLQNKLSMLNLLGADNILIGNPDPASPVTILGGAGIGGLFIRQGAVTLQNLNFQDCNAAGGTGGDGAGGGMGSGGALFIDTANVTLHNVNFTGCSATAGLGSTTIASGGGGGGLGGNGGSSVEGAGGGGGYGGNGGDNFGAGGGAGGNGGSNFGGGGGPILGSVGGIGGISPIEAVTITAYTFLGQPTFTPFVVGGGGYGSKSNIIGGTGAGGGNSGGEGGFDGESAQGGNGGNGGSPQMGTGSGGTGNSSTTIPGNPGEDGLFSGGGGGGGIYLDGITDVGNGGGGGGGYSGGGGGGGSGNSSGGSGGGGGGLGGGGGGGFNANGGQGVSGGGNGGNSSIGGGGGGGGKGGGGGGGGFGYNGIGNGGNGGEGGGGGGSYSGGVGGYGAGGGCGNSGGFGGGGGGNGGSGGFGGGGGADGSGGFGGGGGKNGVGGVGATPGLIDQGGNGAALGGALSLGSSNGQPTLTFTGNCTTSLNSASNNSGGSFAGGNDFFIYSGTTLNFTPNTDEVISISQSIIDDSVQSIPVSLDWEAGNGSGGNLQVTGPGIVSLSGINSYSGSTTVSSGILKLVNGTLYAGGAGINSQVNIGQGAILKGSGTINAPTIVLGTLSPGNSIGTIHFNAPLSLPGILSIQITPTASDNSQITSTSTVDLTGTTIKIVPDSGTYNVGAQYTLLTSAGLTGSPTLSMPPQFSGILSYPNNSIVLTILSVPSSVNPAPPQSFKGKVVKNSFLTQTDITNVLKWSPPVVFSEIVSYEISRNGVVIAVVPASNLNVYYDHNRKKNVSYIYTIVSLNANGAKSTSLSIVLKS